MAEQPYYILHEQAQRDAYGEKWDQSKRFYQGVAEDDDWNLAVRNGAFQHMALHGSCPQPLLERIRRADVRVARGVVGGGNQFGDPATCNSQKCAAPRAMSSVTTAGRCARNFRSSTQRTAHRGQRRPGAQHLQPAQRLWC